MKFYHVNDFYFPHVAGPSNHIYDVIQNTFTPKSHSIVTFDYDNMFENETCYHSIPIKRFEPVDQNELQRFLHLGRQNSMNLTSFVNYIREKNPTCLILYYIGYLPFLIRKSLPEIPLVFMPFGYSLGDYQNIYRSKRVKIALCGSGSKKDFINAGADPEQIHIIERPIDTSFFTPMNVKRDPFRLLCVSRFHPIKRIPLLVKMLVPLFRDYSRLHLHIVADTDNSLYTGVVGNELEKVIAIIHEFGIQDRVILRGMKVRDELLREYSEASIHLLPSNLDRRATVVQEAITMGMQCVNTCKRVYDWPEFSDEGARLIHYVDENVENMASVIRCLLETGPHQSNRDFALKHWSWRQWKPTYEKLMQEW